MLITADQLLAHAIGDYVLQSDWMATEKTKRSIAAALHAVTYAIPFGFFRPSIGATALIIVSHFVIDRWRLARFVVFFKNAFWCHSNRPFSDYQTPTGYPAETPAWLAVWLLIIADNVLHVLINGIALKFL